MEDTAMLSIKACRSVLLPAAFAISAMLLAAPASRADTLNYTFSGVGSGAITGNTNTTFTNANFSINFTEDPADVVGNGTPGYYLLEDITGTLTEGAYSATVTGATIEVNANGSQGGNFSDVFLFDTSYGSIGIFDDPDLYGYNLATPGSFPGSNGSIGAYQSSSGYTTTSGDTVSFSGLSSLDFDVTPTVGPVPEPSTLALLSAGLGGLALLRRRFQSL
jgi:hypothetical protein